MAAKTPLEEDESAVRPKSTPKPASIPPLPIVKAAPKAPPVTYRPRPTNTWRFVRAYTTTFQVIGSYFWLAFLARFFGHSWQRQRVGAVHKRNAALVNATILELQGLFIKVGQLLSIMANFLPEEFRSELEGLQDQVPPRPFAEIRARIESELGNRSTSSSRASTAPASPARRSVRCTRRGSKDGAARRGQGPAQGHRRDRPASTSSTIRRIMTIVQWFVPVAGARRLLPPDQGPPLRGARLRARGRQHRAHLAALHVE